MERNFKFLLDFVVDLKADPTKIKKLSSDISSQLSDVSVDVDIDKNELQKNLESFLTDLSKLDPDDIKLNLDAGNAEVQIEDLMKLLQGNEIDLDLFKDIDTSDFDQLSKVFDDLINSGELVKLAEKFKGIGDVPELDDLSQKLEELENSMNGVDTEKFNKAFADFENSVSSSRNELTNLIESNKKALQSLSNSGNSGSDVYKQLETEIKEAENSLDELNTKFGKFETKGVKDITELLKDLEDSLDSNDPIAYAKAIDNISEASTKAEKEITSLISKNKQALTILEASGKQGGNAYNKLEQEIKEAEEELKKFQSVAEEISLQDLDLGGFASTFAKFEAIGLAGQALSDFSQKGIEARDAMLNLEAKTGLTGDALDDLKVRAEKAFKVGIGESLAESINALGTAQQLLGDFLNPDDLDIFTQRAGAIAQVFDKDINEVIGGSRTLIAQYGLDGQRAADLVSFAMQNSGSKMDDTLDTLDEYSGLMKEAGFGAEEFIGTFSNAMTLGARDTDQLIDAIKETQIIINAGDYVSAFDDLIAGANESEKALLKTQKAILDQAKAGEISIKEALQSTSEITKTAFDAGDINASLRDALDVAISGTKAEDLGGELYTKIFSAKIDTNLIQEQAKTAGEQIQNALGPVTILEKLDKEFELFASKTGEIFAPIIAGAGATISKVSELAPAMQLVNNVDLGKLKGQFEGLSNSVNSVVKNSPKLSSAFASIKGGASGLGGSLSKLGPLLVNPFVLGGAAIALYLTQTEKGNELLAKFGDKGKELLEKFQPLSDFFGNVLGVIFEGVGDLIFGLVDTIGVVIETWIELNTAFADMLGITALVNGAFELFGGSMESAGEGGEVLTKALSSFFEYLQLIPLSLNVLVKAFKGVFLGLPQLLLAFFDLAKEVVNPINWFDGGDKISQATDKFKGVVNDMMSEAKDEITNFSLNKSFEEALEVKTKISKVEALDDLLKQMDNAKTEIEKSEIAEAIVKDFPNIKSSYKSIIDENGELVKVLNISADAARNFAESQKESLNNDLTKKQKDFTDTLKVQTTEYDKARLQAKQYQETIVNLSTKEKLTPFEEVDLAKAEKGLEVVKKIVEEKGKEINERLSESAQVGVTLDNIEFPPNVEKDFDDSLSSLRTKAKELNIGEEISNSIQIKGKIDKNNELGNLVKEFELASTDIEKESIANKIKAQAPELIKATGQVVNENGKLVKTYEVATDKVDDFVKAQLKANGDDLISAQNNIVKGIQDEAEARDKLGDDILSKRKEIDEALANNPNADVSELEAEYDKLFNKANKSTSQVIKYLSESKKAGVDVEDQYSKIAKKLDVTVEELENMVKIQDESKDKTKEQQQATEDLAEAWGKVNSELDNSIKKNVAALSELKRQQQATDLTKDQKQDLINQEKAILAETKDQVKQQKNLQKIEEQIAIQTGLKEVKGKTAFELAKEEITLKKSLLDLNYGEFEITQNQLLINKEIVDENIKELNLLNEKNLSNIQDKNNWLEILKTRKLIQKIDAETGEITFNPRIKEVDKNEILKSLQDIDKQIQDNESKVSAIKLTIQKDTDEINKELTELNKERVEWEVGLTLSKSGVYEREVERLKGNLTSIQSIITEYNQEIDNNDRKRDEEILALGDKITQEKVEQIETKYLLINNTIKKKLTEQKKTEFETEKSIIENQEQFYQIRLDNVKKYSEEVLNITTAEYDKTIEEFNRYTDLINNIRDNKNSETEEKSLKAIDERQEKEIKAIEKYLDLEAISKEEAERRKTKILEDGEKERQKIAEKYRQEELKLANIQKGEALAVQNSKELALAKAQEEGAKETLKILQEKYKSTLEVNQIDKIKQAQLDILDAEKALERNAFDEKALLKKELAEKALKENLKGIGEAGQQALLEASRIFAESNSIMQEKGDLINTTLEQFSGAALDGIAGMFEGDEEAMKTSMKAFLQQMGGFLKKQLEAFILGLILSEANIEALSVIPFPLNTIVAGTIALGTRAAIGALADPIISGLTSFATGGRVDEPTLAWIGDASNARPGADTEWVVRDDQIKQIITMANEMSNNGMIAMLSLIASKLDTLKLETVLRGDDIYITNQKAKSRVERRSV